MNETNYWQRKIGRRRVLGGAAGAGGALLAASLIGCSDDEGSPDTGSAGESESSRITKAQDTSSSAKRGGTYKGLAWTDLPSLDVLTTGRLNVASSVAYQHLIKGDVSVGPPKEAKFVGDLAESWEMAADNLSITFKLRANAATDPRPPTSGRTINADDVVWSWERFVAASPLSSQLANKVNPSAPVQSVEKVDERTVRFKLAFPWAPLLATFSFGQFVAMPREAESQYDPKIETRGSGPWMVQEWRPGDRFSWKKNPNYFDKSYPLVDGFEEPIIVDYPTRIAQFNSKAVWDLCTLGYQPTPSDVISIANSQPDVNLYFYPTKSSVVKAWGFGQQPGTIWGDQRLRQAVSYALDREIHAYTQSGADLYEKAGLPTSVSLGSSMLTDYWGDYYLDPQGSEIGDGAKFYKRNIEEAKKLLSAAGYPNGLTQPLHTFTFPEWVTDAEIYAQNLADIGIKVDIDVHDFNGFYLSNILIPGAGKTGNYEGLAAFHTAGTTGDVFNYMLQIWHTTGSLSAARAWSDGGQAKIDSMIEAGLKEFDANKRKQLAWDLQKFQATYQGAVSYNYSAQPIQLSWKWVKNFMTHVTSDGLNNNNRYDRVWIDESLMS